MTSPAASRARWIWARLVRLASIGAGLIVEYREVFVAHSAQWVIVFLGLWLMAVPPALWLDSLRRLSTAAASVASPDLPGKDKEPEQ